MATAILRNYMHLPLQASHEENACNCMGHEYQHICNYFCHNSTLTVHKKNWLPLVFGPAFAMDRMPACGMH
jgi:hypothetical protein